MRHVVPVALLITAVIHALPLLGLTGGARLASLYGITDMDASLEILLRHRAVLFGLLKYTVGLRPSEEAEREGLDLAEHGERAYNY